MGHWTTSSGRVIHTQGNVEKTRYENKHGEGSNSFPNRALGCISGDATVLYLKMLHLSYRKLKRNQYRGEVLPSSIRELAQSLKWDWRKTKKALLELEDRNIIVIDKRSKGIVYVFTSSVEWIV